MLEIQINDTQKDDTANEAGHVGNVNSCWMSVKDRLPECIHIVEKSTGELDKYSDAVLAWCDNKLMVLSLQYGFFGENGEYGRIWCNHFGNINQDDPEWDDQYDPTHWMPLPTRPSGSEIKN